jgi:hypothetical protein
MLTPIVKRLLKKKITSEAIKPVVSEPVPAVVGTTKQIEGV